MASDLQLVAGQYGDPIEFLLKDVNGDVEDLTIYSTVRLLISTADFTSNVYSITDGSSEIDTTNFNVGILKWTPSQSNPVPAFGFYWLTIYKEANGVNTPIRKYFLEVVRRVTA